MIEKEMGGRDTIKIRSDFSGEIETPKISPRSFGTVQVLTWFAELRPARALRSIVDKILNPDISI